MSGGQPDLADLKKRMDSALEVLRKELQGLRTGRASASLLEPIVVEAYGSEMTPAFSEMMSYLLTRYQVAPTGTQPPNYSPYP